MMFTLLLVAPVLLALAQAVSTEKWEYVLDVNVIIDKAVLKNYMEQHAFNESTAKEHIKEDLDYIINEVNNYFDTLEEFDMDLEVRVNDVLEHSLDDGFEYTSQSQTWHSPEWVFDAYRKYVQADKWNQRYLNTAYSDAVVLLTGARMRSTGGQVGQSSACSKDNAWVFTAFTGTQQTAYNLAHEFGHLLGAKHDNQPDCPYARDTVMAAVQSLYLGKRARFSKCSADKIKAFIHSESGKCIRVVDVPFNDYDTANYKGDMMKPTQLCQRYTMEALGEQCKDVVYDNVCTTLYCRYSYKYVQWLEGSYVCDKAKPDCGTWYKTECKPYMPMEGMECGDGKRCKEGKCVR